MELFVAEDDVAFDVGFNFIGHFRRDKDLA